MSVLLQDFYRFDRLWEWTPGGVREVPRAEVDRGRAEPFRTPHQAAWIDGQLVGLRPSGDGPVLVLGPREIPLDPATDRVEVRREARRVTVRGLRGADASASILFELAYTAGPEEFDTWEGRDHGLFDWLAERLAGPEPAAVGRG